MSNDPIAMRRDLMDGINILCKQPQQANEELLVQTIMNFKELVSEISQGVMQIHVSFDEKLLQKLEGK